MGGAYGQKFRLLRRTRGYGKLRSKCVALHWLLLTLFLSGFHTNEITSSKVVGRRIDILKTTLGRKRCAI